MKIVFFGTPEFAVPSLNILIENNYEVVGVVTAPDKKAGRGLKMKSSAIKEVALEAGLEVLQPVKLSDPDFIEQLRLLQADLFIVVAFRMLPEVIWQMPKKGTFNLHSSLLPDYRGAAPINRAIMNGETQTGVTTFFLQHEIDTGNILMSKSTNIGIDETAGELHDRLKIIGAEVLLATVKAIENDTVNPVNQQTLISADRVLKTAPKIFADDCAINWNQPAKNVHDHIRGLSPFPGSFTTFSNATGNKLLIKIYRTKISPLPAELKPGSIIIIEKKLYICCNDLMLEVLELQQEGKKKISAKDFISGFRNEAQWTWTGTN